MSASPGALVLEPQLVICDEPISALDVSIQAQVINLLKDFQEEKKVSYLFIAHDLSMVRYVSDDVGVMYLGQMVELCEADEIYAHPLHPYTKGLLGSIPIANPRLAREKEKSSIEGDIPSPINPPAGCRFHTRCPYAKPECAQEKPQMKDVGGGPYGGVPFVLINTMSIKVKRMLRDMRMLWMDCGSAKHGAIHVMCLRV